MGFQMMDPLKTAKARVDFVRPVHDREALLPAGNPTSRGGPGRRLGTLKQFIALAE